MADENKEKMQAVRGKMQSLLLDVINFSLDAKHWQQVINQSGDRTVSNLGMFQRVIYLHVIVVDIFCTACIISVIIYLRQFTATINNS